jgi:hypothetical protein
MSEHIRDFDHLMWAVRDLEAAGATFARMGFTVGPITPRPHLGTANRRVSFTPIVDGAANYFELAQFVGPPERAYPLLRRFLAGAEAGREGVRAFIMHTPDAAAAHAHFAALDAAQPDAGFAPAPLMVTDYEHPGPDGTPLGVAFTNCILPALRAPFPISLCQIRGWDFYANPVWCSHANGARAWVAAIAVADDPAATARELHALWGGAATIDARGVWRAQPGRIALHIMTSAQLSAAFGAEAVDTWQSPPYIAGVQIQFPRLDSVRAALHGLTVADTAERIVVPPRAAHGALLVFEQGTA